MKRLLFTLSIVLWVLISCNPQPESPIQSLRIRAEKGDVSAQMSLATAYQEGDGIEKNYEEAFKWYLRAAESGDKHALTIVGGAYKIGKGVQKDDKMAFEYFMRAALKNERISQVQVGLYYYMGKGNIEIDLKEASYWFYLSILNKINDEEEYKDFGMVFKNIFNRLSKQEQDEIKKRAETFFKTINS